MIYTLLGKERYFAGIALYFERHDGRAVTIEDFVEAMQDASGRDLTQFARWYHQAGTPVVSLTTEYDAAGNTFRIDARQHCEPAPGQVSNQPLHIPLSIGLIAPDGKEVGVGVLEITEAEQTFVFDNVEERPVLSALRDFSAPIELRMDQGDQDLATLMRFDTDAFARWEATQRLFLRAIHERLRSGSAGQGEQRLTDGIAWLLEDKVTDRGLIAQLITLPDEPAVAAGLTEIDMGAIDAVRRDTARQIAESLQSAFQAKYDSLRRAGDYRPEPAQIAQRTLRHVCLDYLVGSGDPPAIDLCIEHIESADNLTDALAGLTILSRVDCDARSRMIEAFFDRWCGDPLVLNKWFFVVGASPVPGALDGVKRAMAMPEFEILNPAHGMNLLGGFCRRNYVEFHNPDGSGYEFLADMLLQIDKFRPDAGAWLMPQIMQWRRHEPAASPEDENPARAPRVDRRHFVGTLRAGQ